MVQIVNWYGCTNKKARGNGNATQMPFPLFIIENKLDKESKR